jgi:hypothetical protein
MWNDRNRILHDSSNADTTIMKSAAIDAEITKLYKHMETYAVEDRQFFNLPLALRLRKPLRARRRWLALAKVLTSVSTHDDRKGQTLVNMYFPAVHNVHPKPIHQEIQLPAPPPQLRQQLLTSLLQRLPTNPTRQSRPSTSMQVTPVRPQRQPTINSIFLRRPMDPESRSR